MFYPKNERKKIKSLYFSLYTIHLNILIFYVQITLNKYKKILLRYFIFSEPNYSTSNLNLNETKIPCEPGKTAFLMSCKQSRCTMYIVGCSVVSRTFFRLFLSNDKLKEIFCEWKAFQ